MTINDDYKVKCNCDNRVKTVIARSVCRTCAYRDCSSVNGQPCSNKMLFYQCTFQARVSNSLGVIAIKTVKALLHCTIHRHKIVGQLYLK
jgi:hypothetical protein